jgi:hypothetical protein
MRDSVRHGGDPDQKAGPVFFRQEAKNLPVPPQAALLTGPPPRRKDRAQGRDEGMGFRIEQRDGDLNERHFGGFKRLWT